LHWRTAPLEIQHLSLMYFPIDAAYDPGIGSSMLTPQLPQRGAGCLLDPKRCDPSSAVLVSRIGSDQ
jgi:hypothetical protein